MCIRDSTHTHTHTDTVTDTPTNEHADYVTQTSSKQQWYNNHTPANQSSEMLSLPCQSDVGLDLDTDTKPRPQPKALGLSTVSALLLALKPSTVQSFIVQSTLTSVNEYRMKSSNAVCQKLTETTYTVAYTYVYTTRSTVSVHVKNTMWYRNVKI